MPQFGQTDKTSYMKKKSSRPPGRPKNKWGSQEDHISVRVFPELKQLTEDAADHLKMEHADWVRLALRETAEKHLASKKKE